MSRQEVNTKTNTTWDDTSLEYAPTGFRANAHVPLLILAVIIVILNGTIVGLFVRKRSLRSFTNYFLVSLAISDLLTGLVTIPLFISCNAIQKKDICLASNQGFVFTALSTILHITAITADRYVAIMKSLRYQDLVTKKRVQLVTAAIWICCLFLTLIQLAWTAPSEMDPNDISSEEYVKKDLVYAIIFIFLGVIPIPFLVLAYCRIFAQILRQNREHNRLVRGAGGERPSTRERRTVSMFVLMLIAYCFLLLPNASLRIEMNVKGTLDEIPSLALFIIILLCFLNSMLNPCFYGFGKHDFRFALVELLRLRKMLARKQRGTKSRNESYTRTAC